MEEDIVGEFKSLRDRCDYMVTYEQAILYQLANLLRPEWTEGDVFEATTKLLHTVGPLLGAGVSPDQLRQIAMAPSPDNKPIILFINIRTLRQILSSVSCASLCSLSSTVPAGDPAQRQAFLVSVQDRFQVWSNRELENLKLAFDQLPNYLQHNFIMEKLQNNNTSPQVCNAIQELLRFPIAELIPFKAWLESLDGASLNVIANLFQFPEDFILKTWTLLCGPIPHSSSGLGFSQGIDNPWHGNLSSSNNFTHPFPMNVSDDTSIQEWSRNKKRTAGGGSKHIINLTDSSAGFIQLRLSSSLNMFAPATKKMPIAAGSPSGYHEMLMPSPDVHSMGLRTGLTATQFDSLLAPSEAPPLSDNLRASNWTLLPSKAFLNEAEDQFGSNPNSHPETSIEQHFNTPAPTHPHQGDELRTVTGLAALSISQEYANSHPTHSDQSHDIRNHNMKFFPAMPEQEQNHPQDFGSVAQFPEHEHLMPQIEQQYNMPMDTRPPQHGKSSSNIGYINGVKVELRLVGSPPAKSVYQRILKPFPIVKVIGADKLDRRVLFVKASLWNADGTEQLNCIEGGLQVAAQPTTATFKKLKVMNTSVQKGTLFKLKFQLELFGTNEPDLDIHVWSDPMEVVSHTVYLTNPSSSTPTPATVYESIPSASTVGSKVVILGASFLDIAPARVMFGDVIAQHVFHESGTLIATVPPQAPGVNRVKVTVSNDGQDYSATFASFTYLDTK